MATVGRSGRPATSAKVEVNSPVGVSSSTRRNQALRGFQDHTGAQPANAVAIPRAPFKDSTNIAQAVHALGDWGFLGGLLISIVTQWQGAGLCGVFRR